MMSLVLRVDDARLFKLKLNEGTATLDRKVKLRHNRTELKSSYPASMAGNLKMNV
jgi:hypothetical protein